MRLPTWPLCQLATRAKGVIGGASLAPCPFPLGCRIVAVLASVLCPGCLIPTAHLLTASQTLPSQAPLHHQPPFILSAENHSTSNRKTRAVLDQVGGWLVTQEESSECPAVPPSPPMACWPPGGARAGRGGRGQGGQQAAPSAAILCAGSRAIPPSL